MIKVLSVFTTCLSILLSTTACSKGDAQLEEPKPPPATDTAATMTQNTYTSTRIGNVGYWLYTPANATANMPLIVYLHGGSGRGGDLNLVVSGSLPQFLKDGLVKNIPAYILMPQCPSNGTWETIGSTVKELVDKIVADKKINPKKVSLTGHSLGGSGTWNLGATYSTTFSAIAPLSGGANTASAASYTSIPVWAFVGSADTIVDPSSSQTIVPLINNAGGSAQIKVYAGATHFDVPALVYKDASVDLLSWLISKTK